MVAVLGDALTRRVKGRPLRRLNRLPERVRPARPRGDEGLKPVDTG
jgi:hypothetical protein